jgi:hypothetical protein
MPLPPSLILLSAAALAAICLNLIVASTDALARTMTKPTIVLVHGAFAEASGFGAATDRLQRRGYTVITTQIEALSDQLRERS